MTSLPGSLFRGVTVLAIGALLAVSHITFAAAAPRSVQVASSTSEAATDVDTTSSISPSHVLAENCYIDTQAVKGMRGKLIVLRVVECD
jgi:hypothetical protein